MSRIIYIILLLIIASCSTLTTTDTSKTPEHTISPEALVDNKNISTRLYEVTTTDTLISIARRYNTTPQMLIQLNNLQKPYTINPGLLIKVPAITPDTQPEELRVVHIAPKQ